MESAPLEYDAYCFFRFKEGDEFAFEKIFKADYNRMVGFCQQ